MKMEIVIRQENAADRREVETLTREAFWNVYVPGCDEHYLVHTMRDHPDFVDSLNFVAVYGDRLVGSIMYTRSHLLDEADRRLDTLTFGPLSVLPEYQRKGIGSALIEHSKNIAAREGFPAVIIYGSPSNYCKHGFRSSKDMHVANSAGKYPYALLILELAKGALAGHDWRFFESEAYSIDSLAAAEFDKAFAPKEKAYRYTQEEFAMACRAYIE